MLKPKLGNWKFKKNAKFISVYFEYLTTSGITNVYDETMFCHVTVEIRLEAGNDDYALGVDEAMEGEGW